MIVPTANYPTSRDYTQLWELAHTAAIVCIVDMEHGKPDTCRDIARTVHSPEWSPELVQVGSRGIGHVWAESLDAFIAQCEHCNLEWLVPPAPPAPEVGEFITQLKRYAKYGTPIRLIPFVVARAATVLQQQQQLLTLAAPAPAVVPVAVTERLPGEGDCDTEGRCWVHMPRRATPTPNWTLLWTGHLQPYHSHWLSHHAIPLPQGGEVEG